MADQKEQPATRLGQQADPPFMVEPPGCRYTPDEVGRMLGNRVVQPHYAAWLVRKAVEAAALGAARRSGTGDDGVLLDWLEQHGCHQFQGPYRNDPRGPAHRWFDTDTSDSDYSPTLRDAIRGAMAAQEVADAG